MLNKLLDGLEDDKSKSLSAEETQSRTNLISSIVAGIAATIDPTAAASASLAATIEVENNSLYKNRDKVARLKADVTAKAMATCGDNNHCLQSEFDRADRMAAAYDTVLTLRHYPEMSKEKADLLAQSVLDLAPGVSTASSLYELVKGKTATGEEANRYFASIGLIPVFGGMIKKGGQTVQQFARADKALDTFAAGTRGNTLAGNGASALLNARRILESAEETGQLAMLSRAIQTASIPGKRMEEERGATVLTNPSAHGNFVTQTPGLPSEPIAPITVPGRKGEVLAAETISTPNNGPILVDPIYSTNKKLIEQAEKLGYGQRISPQKAPFNSHGQAVFWNGKNYITPDVDAHNVSDGWKKFDRRGERLGTYDSELNEVKK